MTMAPFPWDAATRMMPLAATIVARSQAGRSRLQLVITAAMLTAAAPGAAQTSAAAPAGQAVPGAPAGRAMPAHRSPPGIYVPPKVRPPNPAQAAQRAKMAAAAAKILADAGARQTPRAADGHPDLSGYWTAPVGQGWTSEKQGGSVVFNFPEYGPGGKPPLPADGPKYKPELKAKVDYNDEHSSFVDKSFNCGMPGVPRAGPPQQIVQTRDTALLLYVDVAGEIFRSVPLDGRGYRDEIDASYNGDSVGHWDGDTLVVETKNFTDETWIGGRGYFHSDQMTVRETLTRHGDVLDWTATVTDPAVLTEPWTTTRSLVPTTTRLEEPPPCTDLVRDHLVNNDNHS